MFQKERYGMNVLKTSILIGINEEKLKISTAELKRIWSA